MKTLIIILIWVSSFFMLATDVYLLRNFWDWPLRDTWIGGCSFLLISIMFFGSVALGIWLTVVCIDHFEE